MEPLIAGTRRLVDLALSSPHALPPRLVFTSSIGVVRSEYVFRVAYALYSLCKSRLDSGVCP
jgi:nucleoside-diphosphate-sugar epimerase